MPVLSQVSELVSRPLGSLVYHFLLLLAVQAALALAWGEWKRTRREPAQRLLFAMAGLTFVHVAYLAVALLTRTALVDARTILPPLERFVSTASLGFLVWAFLPPRKDQERTRDVLLAANLILALGALVVFTALWAQAQTSNATLDYNLYWQSTIWTVWQIGLIFLVIFGVLRNQEEGWGTVLVAMIVMLAGQVLQLAYARAIPGPNLPVWERLCNLVAYPLIAVAVYQRTLAGLHVHSQQLQNISQASLDQIKSLLHLFEASQRMSSSLDLSTVLENAVQGVARALDADQCAIAFPVEDDPSQMYLSAIYNPDRPGRGETITFPLEFQLAVQHAMRRKRHMIVEESDNVQLRALFGLLGASGTGPLLVQPLLAQGEAIGAIIVGNARSHRPFTPNEAKLCRSLSEQLVNAIQNTRHYRTAQQRIEELSKGQTVDQQVSQHTQELTSQLEEMEALVDSLREARHDLETKLVSSRAEAETLAQRLATLENILASQRAQWHGTLQAMLPGMAAGVLVADENGIVQGTNVAAEILLERDGTDLQGLDLIEISDDEEWRQAITSAQRGEAAHLALSLGPNMIMCDVAPLPQDDGLSSSDASLLADEGTSQGIVVVLQGLSSEAETQRARLETIASMTEELRSPMSTVIGYTDLLLSEAMGGVASAQRKFLLRIKADAERLVQIINDLAREAGSEEGWTHPVRQMVDMNELVEDALSAARTQFETKSLTVDLELAEDLPTVGADPNYVQRVVSCLLSNAALASPVGSEIQVLTAHLGVASPDNPAGEQPGDPGTNGFVRVSVQDNGDGLPHEALGQVFERTRPSQTPSGLGESGAGLALARTMIEAHGGRLWAESTEGRGTTFAFVLPADGQSAQQSTGHPVAARHGASSPMAVPG